MNEEHGLTPVMQGDPTTDGRQATYQGLRNKVPLRANGEFDFGAIFEKHNDTSKYAKRVHVGIVREEYRERLNALEVSMLVDGGYSHFGGSTSYNPGTGWFSITIYTD